MSFDILSGSPQSLCDELNGAILFGPFPYEGLPLGTLTLIFNDPAATITFDGAANALVSARACAAELVAAISGCHTEIRSNQGISYVAFWLDDGWTIDKDGTANAQLKVSTSADTTSEGSVDTLRIRGFSQGATNGYYTLLLSEESSAAESGTSGSTTNTSDLSATDLPEGTIVYVRSVRDQYVAMASTRTVDGIDVLVHADTALRWERRRIAHPSWGFQASWGIDPVSGNDNNLGTQASPLKTAAEFSRRTKGIPFMQFTTLEVFSDIPITDNLRAEILIGDITPAATDSFWIKGQRTVLATSAVTTFTALNRATPAKNTMTVTAFDFTPYVGKRLRMTSGVSSGYSAWILTGGVGSCTLSSFCLDQADPPAVTHAVFPTLSTSIAAADTFQIIDLTSLGQLNLELKTLGHAGGAMTNWTSALIVRDAKCIWNGTGGLGNVVPCEASAGNGCRIYFDGCDLGGMKLGTGSLIPANCKFFGGTLTSAGGYGGLGPSISGGCCMGGAVMGVMGTLQLDGDFIFQGTQLDIGTLTASRSMFSAGVQLGNVGFFGQTVDAMNVRGNAYVQNHNANYGSHQIWGATTAGRGIKVWAGGTFAYLTTKPTLNAGLGVGRETMVGGTDKLLSAIPYFEVLNGAALVVEA